MHFDLTPNGIIDWLQNLPGGGVMLISLFCTIIVVLLMLRFLGAFGLFAYMPLASVASGIEVQRLVILPLYDAPIALGVVSFASLFLCSSILASYYGKDTAQKSVWAGLCAMPLMLVFMIFAMGYPAIDPALIGEDLHWTENVAGHIQALFTPAFAIAAASMAAFFTSQRLNVYLLLMLEKTLGRGNIALAALMSMSLAMLVDTAIFAALAWNVFSPNPASWQTVFDTYFLPYFILKWILVMAMAPIVQLAERFLPRDYKRVFVKQD